ncbi:MAG TPA: ABC transporter permease [Pseudonocardiaceae bacterium]|nr:ABC transporter permease [Pseudonocardiaceae bacterium]
MHPIVRKLITFVVTLWAAVTVNFFLPRLMPGTPADAALAKLAGNGPVSPAQKQAIEDTLGVPHGSVWSQYVSYLDDAVHGRFGVSYTYFPASVVSLIRTALPWTLVLVGFATVLAFVVGTLLGVLAAWRRGGGMVGAKQGSAVDRVATVGSTFTSAFPYFWTALLLLFVFAFKLNWFPIKGGYQADTSPNWSFSFIVDAAFHSVLPAVTILVSGLGGWLLGMRNNMINTLGADYVTFAEANGLRGRTVALRYAARNALLPSVTAFGMALGLVVGGSLLTEVVFAYPGVGYLLYNAVVNEDFPLMQALFLVITLSVLVANLIVDLLYGLLDPRARRA